MASGSSLCSQAQESLESTFRKEAESATRRAHTLDEHIGEVRSKVENLCNALSEVRELAEGAQKKAESTEAHLERVSRLEAEVSALRIRVSVLPPSGWDSAIVPDFPKLFEDFKERQFTLLWRGNRDGFGGREFHGHCDGHPNTMTVILDTNGNTFGGFTPVRWESPPIRGMSKVDKSLKSFLFTLKNPYNVPAQRFALKAKQKDFAIFCNAECGPHLCDIAVCDNCDGNAASYAAGFGCNYTNNTGLDGTTFFTGSPNFKVKDIEVFEITN
jgi:hypothetical protein